MLKRYESAKLSLYYMWLQKYYDNVSIFSDVFFAYVVFSMFECYSMMNNALFLFERDFKM